MNRRNARTERPLAALGAAEIEALGLLHDLRSPLSAAANAFQVLEVLITQPDDAETRFFRDTVRASLRHAWHVVEEWHEALAATSPAAPSDRTDVRSLCHEVLEHLDLGASRTSIRVEGCPAVGVPPAVLRVILRNLLSNAMRYRREGIPLEITIGGAPRGRLVELYVRDNGRGMAPSHVQHAFRAFWRGPEESQASGLGLGLSLVQHVVAQRGGQTRIESRHGAGTTVSFTLPAAR
jgi:signal transduction histidine kinase